jgi:D-alanyl-lipoteichoic acid acyltransferase DltB (MBOAT superfamily)
MFLGGLWHGASWNFIIWGVLHGSILAMERIWSEVRKNSFPSMKQVPPWIGIVLTFHFVTFAWIFFRLENFSDTISYLKGFIYPAEQVTSISIWIFVLIIIGMFFHFTPDNLMQRIASRLSNLKAWQVALVASIWLLVIEALRPEGVAAFIYYQF